MKKNLDYFREKLDTAGIKIKPNFEGISTFLSVPYEKDINMIDIALVGVPFDIAASGTPGARLAPQAVRNCGNSSGVYNRENIFPYEKLVIADIGDVTLDNRFSIEKTHQDIQKFFSLLKKKDIIPLTVGGDHSITLPILRAIAENKPVSLIHFDAHRDTEEGYGGSQCPHGSTFLNAARENLILPKNSCQVGIRDGWEIFWNDRLISEMKTIDMKMIYDREISEIVEMIRSTVGSNRVYLSFDIDCLDPAFAPGTGTPEVGGLTSYQAIRIIRELKGLNIIGADIVEICPPLDQSDITALAGSTILFELLCIISDFKGS